MFLPTRCGTMQPPEAASKIDLGFLIATLGPMLLAVIGAIVLLIYRASIHIETTKLDSREKRVP